MSQATQLHDRRYLDDYLQMIHRSGLPSHVKAEVCQQVQQAVIDTVKWTLEQALQEELTAELGLARYEHLPQGRMPERTRSGSYTRTLLTQFTLLPEVQVPKLRRGNRQRHWQILERVDGMWVKIAYPTGDLKVDARSRRRAAKRKQKRVVLTALGV